MAHDMRSEECAHCGFCYEDLLTGLSYRDVFDMLWSSSSNPQDWRYRRRGTVLGVWHAIKLQLWAEHLENCAEESERFEERMAIECESEFRDVIVAGVPF